MNKGLDHIRDIVTTQQSYARAPTNVLEPLVISDFLEDALRMNVGSVARHEVNVVKHWPNVPEALLDKHLILQIIVNLVGNAIQAMEPVTDRPRRLILRAEKITVPRPNAATDTTATDPSVGADPAVAGLVRVEVEDNGEGITPENLALLFTHGFTTRKSGHGFGLHSCALAAKAMGATIRAHSDGPGKGARFTLDLPFNTLDNRRILLVDDMPEIHTDFRKILARATATAAANADATPIPTDAELEADEAILFGAQKGREA